MSNSASTLKRPRLDHGDEAEDCSEDEEEDDNDGNGDDIDDDSDSEFTWVFFIVHDYHIVLYC